MNRLLTAKLTLTLMVGCALALVATLMVTHHSKSDINHAMASSTAEPNSNQVYSLKGFRVTETLGDRAAITLAADELKIVPRHFGDFKINPFFEMDMTNLQMNIFLESGEKAENYDPFKIVLGLDPRSQQFKQAGPLLYRKTDGFSLLIHRSRTPWFHVTAEEAIFDARKDQVKFTKAILKEVSSGRRIAGRAVTWDKKTGLFIISGPYVLESSDGIRQGNGIAVDSNFNLRSIAKH